MSKIIVAMTICLTTFATLAQDPGVAEKAPDADKSSDKAAESAPTAAASSKTDAFKPPPGFQTKKRGDLVLYCKKDATIGTRFKTEKCYDEAQMRDYLLALELQQQDVDRIRATCGGGTVCNPPDPTRAP
jgi:hypothetical protein